MMRFIFSFFLLLVSFVSASEDRFKLPELTMPENNLSFSTIQGYEDYHIVATHFRTDKKELRYILANPIAYEALKNKTEVMPDGSILVKIGWDVEEMELFPSALEAKEVQRVEYMIKDSKRFDHDGDHWGYARFVKQENAEYKSWDKGTQSCISCHQIAKENDYLFTRYQKVF